MQKHKVTLSLPWTDGDGKDHQQGETVEVDRPTRNRLTFLGRARDVAETKPSTPPADGKVK